MKIDTNTKKPGGVALTHIQGDWLERAALGASMLCLVHCLALPLVLAALPTVSAMFAVPESIHLWILGFALPTSGIALFGGRTTHGASWPVAVGAIGLALLAAGAIVFAGSPFETWVSVAGSLTLATAHVANWRLRHVHPAAIDDCSGKARIVGTRATLKQIQAQTA